MAIIKVISQDGPTYKLVLGSRELISTVSADKTQLIPSAPEPGWQAKEKVPELERTAWPAQPRK